MVREINRLSALKVKAARKPGRYADGDGLYLYVTAAGNRSWIFRYRDRVTGKLRDKGLGPERDVPLEKARGAAAACRESLRAGSDPIDAQRDQKLSLRLERARRVTFGQCVTRYIDAHAAGWRNAKHAAQWSATLDTHAATLKDVPIAEIDVGQVLACLEPIWSDKTETATRVRQRIEAVLDWATARQLRTGENPARWRGHLQKLLPAPAKVKRVEHRAALPYTDAPALMVELAKLETTASAALRLQVLTAARPGEATGARWDELDLDAGLWTVSGDRMKAGREHRVPLAPQVVQMLKALPRTADHVFPGKPGKPITTAATLKLLKASYPHLSAHGFRSTFRDWAAERTAYSSEVVEGALAHAIKDKTEAAYRRTDLLARRAKLMAEWARFCAATTATGEVTPLRKKSGARR